MGNGMAMRAVLGVEEYNNIASGVTLREAVWDLKMNLRKRDLSIDKYGSKLKDGKIIYYVNIKRNWYQIIDIFCLDCSKIYLTLKSDPFLKNLFVFDQNYITTHKSVFSTQLIQCL